MKLHVHIPSSFHELRLFCSFLKWLNGTYCFFLQRKFCYLSSLNRYFGKHQKNKSLSCALLRNDFQCICIFCLFRSDILYLILSFNYNRWYCYKGYFSVYPEKVFFYAQSVYPLQTVLVEFVKQIVKNEKIKTHRSSSKFNMSFIKGFFIAKYWWRQPLNTPYLVKFVWQCIKLLKNY